MIEWILDHWEPLLSLLLALVNFLYAFLIHAKSTSRIKSLANGQKEVDEAFYEVLEKTHSLIESMKGD